MSRVLRQLRRVRKSADVDAVHDARVAIRRCRSVAAIMEEVDAHPAWKAMDTLPRKMFHALGELRDLHVLENWAKKLTSEDDSLRRALLKALDDRQAKAREQVVSATRTFDRNAWTRLIPTLSRRARLVPPDSLTARCLALERYQELRRRHSYAVRTEASRPWHALRIALKRFRYTAESLLPRHSLAWEEGLARLQDLLGAIHDLDVLKAWIKGDSDGVDANAEASLRVAIETERRARIERYRQHTGGDAGLLEVWKAGLMHETSIAAATAARLRTMARSMDPRPRRTAEVSRLALRIFDKLGRAGAEPRFRDDKLRLILETAARLHGIRDADRHKPQHKAARDLLRTVPVPLGWKPAEWALLTEVVRYHRGAEPSPKHKAFARLSPERQDRVRGLAGVLRLARGLRRCGARTASGMGAGSTATYLRLRVAGVKDTRASAARLAAAKHLLETYLKRPILIESAARTVPVRPRRT
jgi:CHAD domain-containing protein